MEPGRFAAWIEKYRNAATLAIAGVIALVMTLDTQRGFVQLGPGRAMKYFIFVFVVVAVLVAIAFTIVLVFLETKAAKQKREDQPQLPTAVANPTYTAAKPAAPTPAPPAAKPAPAPPAKPTPEPPSDHPPGDGPSILR